MNLKTTLFVTGMALLGASAASCRPAPPAMPIAAAVPQTVAQQPPPPPPPPSSYAVPPPPPRGRPRPGPPPPEQSFAATTTVQGSVRSFSYGPAGDVNGIILEPGTEVHVPPDQATQLNSLAPVGARVHATGWLHTGPLGDTHVDATTITNLNNQNTLNFQTPPPPPDPGAPPPPNANPAEPPPAPPPVPSSVDPSAVLGPATLGTDATITGVVRSFNFGPAGEVNGLILSEGTVVYFPPDQGNQVTLLVRRGMRVRVRGWVRQGPAGNELLSAETITNRATGNSITLTNQPPPPPR